MKDWIFIFALFFVLCFSGCTLSFKAKDIELEGERQRVQQVAEFRLEKATVL